MKLAAANTAARQLHGRQLGQGTSIEQAQFVATIDIGLSGNQAGIFGRGHAADVPGDVWRDALQRVRLEVVVQKFAKFAESIADNEQSAVVSREGTGEIARLLGHPGLRQQLSHLPRYKLEHPGLRFIGRQVAGHCDPAIVARHCPRIPAAAVEFDNQPCRFGLQRIDQPKACHDPGPCAARGRLVERQRAHQHLAAVVQPGLQLVPLGWIGQLDRGLGAGIESKQLGGLIAAAAAGEHDESSSTRLVTRRRHRIRGIGQLLGVGQRRSDAEQLRGVAAGLAVRDQHLAAQRVPVDEAVAAEVGVPRDLIGNVPRQRRDALQPKIRVGLDVARGRRWLDRHGRAGGQQQRTN